MSEHFFKILAAYAVGTAATAVFVRLVWLMPVEDAAKHILSWILPLPAILIVLVLSYYGPSSPIEGENTPSGILRTCLFGALSTFAFCAFIPVTKFIFHKLTGSRSEEDEAEE